MKYIITENKLEQVVIKYLNKMYGDLEEYRTNEYPDKVFYIKGKKVYMEQDLKNEMLLVDYGTIWSDLENMFLLEYDEIKHIISKWLEEVYNIKDVTHKLLPVQPLSWWKRLIN